MENNDGKKPDNEDMKTPDVAAGDDWYNDEDNDNPALRSGVWPVSADVSTKSVEAGSAHQEPASADPGSAFRRPDDISGRSDYTSRRVASVLRNQEPEAGPQEPVVRVNPFSQRPDPLSQRPGPGALFRRPGNIFQDPKALVRKPDVVLDQIGKVRARLNAPLHLKVKTAINSSLSHLRNGRYEEAKEPFREIIAEGYPEGGFYITLIDAQCIVDNLKEMWSLTENEWEYYSKAFHLNLKLMIDSVQKHADPDIILCLTRILSEARDLDLELAEDGGKIQLVEDLPYAPEKCGFREISTMLYLASGGEPNEVGLLLSALEQFLKTDEFKKFEGTGRRE